VVEEVLRALGPRLFRLTHLAVLSPSADLPALHREHVELAGAVRRGDVAGFREMIERHLRSGHDRYRVVAE
jgi:DNA-binding GntR family transcriptional regulator